MGEGICLEGGGVYELTILYMNQVIILMYMVLPPLLVLFYPEPFLPELIVQEK